MDDNKRKGKLKSCKKQSKINRGPLLKPDVMLITKDVMVPLKLPLSSGKINPIIQNTLKTRLRTDRAHRVGIQRINPLLSPGKFEENYKEQSLPQVEKITPEKKMNHETVPKSSFCCLPGVSETQKTVYNDKMNAASLERENLNLRLNPELFYLDVKDRRNNEFEKISQVEKPLTLSARNSISSATTSTETRSCSSNKSLDRIEDSLPKLPLSLICSSESETNNSVFDRRINSEYYPKISIENNNSRNIVEDITESNIVETRQLNLESNTENIDTRHQDLITKEELIIDCKNERDERKTAKNYAEANVSENHSQMRIDVEYLLQSLVINLETVEDFNSFDYCKGNNDDEEKLSQIFNDSSNNSNERNPTMIEFRYSSQDLPKTVLTLDSLNHSCSLKSTDNVLETTITSVDNDDKQSETVYNNPDINLNQSEKQIEIKYSWQIITQTDRTESINNEKNSKLTSTEDLNLNEPEFRYSWQKLTSKYFSEKKAEDSSSDTNQPAQEMIEIPKSAINTAYLKDYSRIHSYNLIPSFQKEEKSKTGQDIGRIAANSPLNHIISSMLPEIKLINRHTSFNDTTAEIIGNCKDNYLRSHARNDSNKSTSSYSSISSIKHIIENLNEMVTTQKHMLEAYVKNHELDQNSNSTKSSAIPIDNSVEKVEIFPSTLHVLGNYIVRDICATDMNDQRNLLDSNNIETVHDHLLSDNSETLQNTRLNKPVASISSEKLPPMKDLADISNMLSHPIPLDSDYYSTVFVDDDNLSRKIENPKKDKPENLISEENRSSLLFPVLGNNHRLTEQNWEPAIADMEGMIGLSLDAAQRIDEGKDDGNEAVPHTKNTGPLKPRVQISFSETKEAGDSKTRKDELLTRLESAMSRLKQSDEHVDANWNLDYSVLDIEENISDKEVKLPKQVEEHIKDIIKSAEEYLAKLEEQLNDLRNADDQIINSSERTFKDIDETYQLFMDNLCQEINKRRNLVRLETEVFKYEGLAPLRACKQEVDAQIRSTQHLIVLTENMLTHPITFNKERLGKIITATSHMGRIPAVPMPEELPYVTFSPLNEEIKKEIVDRISCLGCVLRMGPAQFTEVCERPACLQLKWHIVDPEYASEEQTFIVQKALGEITEPTSPAFETVYVGSEMSCFVRELPVDHSITLRVGIQVSDTAWSVHRIAHTLIPAYSWDMNNSDYLITNSGRIATKVTQNLSTLLSQSAQFSANYIIEFKFLEAASGNVDEGIGLVFEPGGIDETLKRNGALFITPSGHIFMNGEQKLMQLPKMQLGTRIIFTSERKDDETLRMTIECANKAVTYDWTVPTPLHFAARFSEHNKWNLMVK